MEPTTRCRGRPSSQLLLLLRAARNPNVFSNSARYFASATLLGFAACSSEDTRDADTPVSSASEPPSPAASMSTEATGTLPTPAAAKPSSTGATTPQAPVPSVTPQGSLTHSTPNPTTPPPAPISNPSNGGAAGSDGAPAQTATGGSANGGSRGTSTPAQPSASDSTPSGAGTGGNASRGGSDGGGGTAGGGLDDCGVEPVNPNTTAEARRLLCYLYSVYGKGVISGQQETSWIANPADDVDWIMQQTGKFPAILGGDYLYPDGTTDRAKAWWEAGGITMVRYHMGAPPQSDTYDNSKSSSNIDAVLQAGTQENTSFNSKLDYVAGELQKLQDANVAVLWAPFHEVQANGWFWWAKGSGAQFIDLWKYMFDYLTTDKGINNLVWLFPYSNNPAGDYFPGKEYVDIAGADCYDKNPPFESLFQSTQSIVGKTVPIPLHETGVIPDPETMFPNAAPWLLFSVWAGYEKDTSQNSVESIKAAYASQYTITRDELPSFK